MPKKAEKKEILAVGGQALIEGVMMRSQKDIGIAVRRPDGKIEAKRIALKYGPAKSRLVKVPVIRGVIMLWETMSIGFKAIEYSATVASGEEEESGGIVTWGAILFAVLFGLGLFIVAPLLLTKLIWKQEGILFNLIDGVIRVIFFIIYLVFISSFKEIRTVFQYHGAEHMTVAAHEHKEKLTIRNIRKYSPLHPRCGTNFLLIVLIMSIIIFSLITSPLLIVKLLSRIICIPLIAGLAYEFLKFGGKHHKNPLVFLLVLPGLGLQKITTRPPNDKQIEVAIKALQTALGGKR